MASWKFSSPVPVIVKVVTEERFATRRSRPMIMKKRTSSQRLHFYRRLKIRSQAAVTGDVMAADARTLQWSDFGKKVRNLTKCPILVRIWWDFKVSGEIWRNLVEILRFIHMIMYDISIFTLSIAVFDPVLPPTSVNQLDN